LRSEINSVLTERAGGVPMEVMRTVTLQHYLLSEERKLRDEGITKLAEQDYKNTNTIGKEVGRIKSLIRTGGASVQHDRGSGSRESKAKPFVCKGT